MIGHKSIEESYADALPKKSPQDDEFVLKKLKQIRPNALHIIIVFDFID